MAAIDKIYLKNFEEYLQFKEWCEKQPPIKDKYGNSCRLTRFLYKYNKPVYANFPVFIAPCYVDAYLIRNCPFDFIQEELMLNYGHWTQERIRKYYEDVKNYKGDDCPYWAKLEDFITLDDGSMTIKGLEKSSYQKIKDGELYNSPVTSKKYISGNHFRCIEHPAIKYNTPFGIRNWFVTIDTPEGFMRYHKNNNTWDSSEEFVISDWANHAFFHTIRAIKRNIRKWKLPVGTLILVTGRYDAEVYKFVITK